jgi:N-acetylmuramoyl-L-alanine amidase
VISQTGQFAAYENGAVWRVDPDDECYQAIEMELENRTDSEIIYFRTDHYSEYGIPCYQYGDHYFSRKE